jgi:hypothetical protein
MHTISTDSKISSPLYDIFTFDGILNHGNFCRGELLNNHLSFYGTGTLHY